MRSRSGRAAYSVREKGAGLVGLALVEWSSFCDPKRFAFLRIYYRTVTDASTCAPTPVIFLCFGDESDYQSTLCKSAPFLH